MAQNGFLNIIKKHFGDGNYEGDQFGGAGGARLGFFLARDSFEALGHRRQVRQQGEARFGPFRLSFANERLIELFPEGRIVSHGLAGVRKMRSELRTQVSASGTLLDYRLELLPEQWIPASLGVNFMQHELASQFTALTGEMERRLRMERSQ